VLKLPSWHPYSRKSPHLVWASHLLFWTATQARKAHLQFSWSMVKPWGNVTKWKRLPQNYIGLIYPRFLGKWKANHGLNLALLHPWKALGLRRAWGPLRHASFGFGLTTCRWILFFLGTLIIFILLIFENLVLVLLGLFQINLSLPGFLRREMSQLFLK
jgi:hypothetical protein